MRPLSVKKSESMRGAGSSEFRLQAAPRYAEIMSARGYLRARCVRIDITGRRWITFIIIPCDTDTWSAGPIGHGVARRNTWPRQVRARRSEPGGSTRSTNTARIGMILKC